MDRSSIDRRSRELLQALSLEDGGKKIGSSPRDEAEGAIAVPCSMTLLLIYDEPSSGLDHDIRYIIDS